MLYLVLMTQNIDVSVKNKRRPRRIEKIERGKKLKPNNKQAANIDIKPVDV